VEHTPTPTAVEAEVVEARLIRAHRPRFNARGKAVRTPVWVALTADAFPRLTVTRTAPAADRPALGPLPSRRVAEAVVAAVHDALPVRRCTTRMGPATRFAPCALAELGRCLAPCDGRVDVDGYAGPADAAAAVLGGDPTAALDVLRARMAERAAAGRFEEAADARDRVDALLTWVVRTRRDLALRRAGVVAASRGVAGGRREVLVQRAGWLLGTAVADRAEVPAVVRTLAARPAPDDPAPPDEVAVLQRWLAADGVRVEHVDGVLAWPVAAGAAVEDVQRAIAGARRRTGRPDRHLAGKRLVRGG
jgi:DNA polymerase III subunit epsilon